MDKCVVRQAIKDLKNDEIIGYELMIQSDGNDLYDNGSDGVAANTMISFFSENSKRIFDDKCTFVTFTPSLLFRNTPKIFDKERIVIQIEDNIVIHPLANILIGKYREEGYRFAISDFQFTPKYFSMLEYVDYIKIQVTENMDISMKRSMDNIVEMAHGFGKTVIAVGVNSREVYELARELHVDYVEGNYIADTMVTKTSKTEYMQGNLYQLVVEVMKEDPDVEIIEQIISRDASLTYTLLKMANSAYFATHNKITSIRQAVVRVGISQLRQWLYLLSFKEGDTASEELLKTSFMRANFASEIAKIKGFPLTASDAYLLGMFSTLEYMIDAPMEEILSEIPIADEIKDGLILQTGKPGQLYRLLLAYEKAEWVEIKKLAEQLGITTNVMAQIYMECVDTVNDIWVNVVGMTDEIGTDSEEA